MARDCVSAQGACARASARPHAVTHQRMHASTIRTDPRRWGVRRFAQLLCAAGISGCAAAPLMAVNRPVADLRARAGTFPEAGIHDSLQETQLLYGEQVRVRTIKDGWAEVRAIEQPEFSHARRWEGYPGWVDADALSPWTGGAAPNIVVIDKWAQTFEDPEGMVPSTWRFPLGARLCATRADHARWAARLLDGSTVWLRDEAVAARALLRRLSPPARRERILRSARRFLGDAYYWGGRSPQAAGEPFVTGIDCSGLVHLAYRAAGIEIPRDAHEQWLRASRVKTLEPADLVFLSAADTPSRIVHVMLYAGDGELIEAPGTGLTVRMIAARERLGLPLAQLRPGAAINGQTVSFGTFLRGRKNSQTPHPLNRDP